MLVLVVLSGTLTLVLGLNGSSLFVAILQVGVDALRDVIDVSFNFRQTLNSIFE